MNPCEALMLELISDLCDLWQSDLVIIYGLALPLWLLTITAVIYLCERELPKRSIHIFSISGNAILSTWGAAGLSQLGAFTWPQSPLATGLILAAWLVFWPGMTYLAVLLAFNCTPRAALRFWGRWVALTAAGLLLASSFRVAAVGLP